MQVVGRSAAVECNTNNNNGNKPPTPPERTSSYNLYQTGTSYHKKTVSFQHEDSPGDCRALDGQTSTSDAPPTPGVVGTQELYRDPRERIQASRAQPQANYQTPERLSFRDKMRRFAIEAGEDTPVDKSKISRAQQQIEMSTGRQ